MLPFTPQDRKDDGWEWPFNDGLDSVRKTLANDETYRPADFLARLTEFRSLLAAGGATR